MWSTRTAIFKLQKNSSSQGRQLLIERYNPEVDFGDHMYDEDDEE